MERYSRPKQNPARNHLDRLRFGDAAHWRCFAPVVHPAASARLLIMPGSPSAMVEPLAVGMHSANKAQIKRRYRGGDGGRYIGLVTVLAAGWRLRPGHCD
jgi:hypothetical protein